MCTGHFAQVARLIRVHAAGHGQAGGHHVETLDRQNRIEGRVLGAAQGQVAFAHIVRRGQQDAGAALAHFCRQTQQPGLFGTAWMAGYSAAKAAVINFSRAAASEGAPDNIRCNVIIPGVVDTPATAGMLSDAKARGNTEKVIPMKRVGLPVELANAILFLASDEASYVTGASLAVDGGRGSDLYTVFD